jgi:U3 small nucleolar RNA-associated protein 13
MANKQPLKTTFDVDHVIRPIFTGGSVALDNGARILATVLGEDAILTDPTNGKHLAQIEGVRIQLKPCNVTWLILYRTESSFLP